MPPWISLPPPPSLPPSPPSLPVQWGSPSSHPPPPPAPARAREETAEGTAPSPTTPALPPPLPPSLPPPRRREDEKGREGRRGGCRHPGSGRQNGRCGRFDPRPPSLPRPRPPSLPRPRPRTFPRHCARTCGGGEYQRHLGEREGGRGERGRVRQEMVML